MEDSSKTMAEFDKYDTWLDKALIDNTSTAYTASDGETLTTFEDISRQDRVRKRIESRGDHTRDGPELDDNPSEVQAFLMRAQAQVTEYVGEFFSEEQQQARAEMAAKALAAVRAGATSCDPESIDTILIRIFDQPLREVEIYEEMQMMDSLTVNETMTDEITVESDLTKLNQQKANDTDAESLQATGSTKVDNNGLFLVPIDQSKGPENVQENIEELRHDILGQIDRSTDTLSADTSDDESLLRFKESLYKQFEEGEKLRNLSLSPQDTESLKESLCKPLAEDEKLKSPSLSLEESESFKESVCNSFAEDDKLETPWSPSLQDNDTEDNDAPNIKGNLSRVIGAVSVDEEHTVPQSNLSGHQRNNIIDLSGEEPTIPNNALSCHGTKDFIDLSTLKSPLIDPYASLNGIYGDDENGYKNVEAVEHIHVMEECIDAEEVEHFDLTNESADSVVVEHIELLEDPNDMQVMEHIQAREESTRNEIQPIDLTMFDDYHY